MALLTDEQARHALASLHATAWASIELRPGARAEVDVAIATLWSLVPCAGRLADASGRVLSHRDEAHEIAGQVAALCDRGGWTERRLARAALDHLRFGLGGLHREA